MSTFNSKEVVDRLIANDGYYFDDPRVIRIVEYQNAHGGTCWGVVYEMESQDRWFRYDEETHYVRNPKVIWTCITIPGLN